MDTVLRALEDTREFLEQRFDDALDDDETELAEAYRLPRTQTVALQRMQRSAPARLDATEPPNETHLLCRVRRGAQAATATRPATCNKKTKEESVMLDTKANAARTAALLRLSDQLEGAAEVVRNVMRRLSLELEPATSSHEAAERLLYPGHVEVLERLRKTVEGIVPSYEVALLECEQAAKRD